MPVHPAWPALATLHRPTWFRPGLRLATLVLATPVLAVPVLAAVPAARAAPAGLAAPGALAARAGLAALVPSADGVGPSTGGWPLEPRPEVVRGFDPPATPWGSGHRGVDLAGHLGEPVLSARAGRVAFAGRLAGRGVVVVDHGSTRTTYEPVAALVHVGDRVAAGAVLGRLELVGSHCFPRTCLHWGLVAGAQHYLDPLTLVGAAPVRLLPLAPSGPVRGWSPPARPFRLPAFGPQSAEPPMFEPRAGGPQSAWSGRGRPCC